MRRADHTKFTQNEDLALMVLATGGAELIEDSPGEPSREAARMALVSTGRSESSWRFATRYGAMVYGNKHEVAIAKLGSRYRLVDQELRRGRVNAKSPPRRPRGQRRFCRRPANLAGARSPLDLKPPNRPIVARFKRKL